MSVRGSPVSRESSASTALVLIPVAHVQKACLEMEQHAMVSRNATFVNFCLLHCAAGS